MDEIKSIDYETRSGTDIDLGLPRYIGDPEFKPLCLAYQDNGGVGLWSHDEPNKRPASLIDHVARGGKIRGWNVMFEFWVWNSYCVPELDWPELKLEQCVDAMAMAAAMNLPQSLDKCATALSLPQSQLKDKRGKQLIKLLCNPQKEPEIKHESAYKRKGGYAAAQTRHHNWLAKGGRWLNDPALMQELYAYCKQDVVAESSIVSRLRPLSEFEQRVWVKTQEINLRGVPIDQREIENIIKVVQAESQRLNDELKSVTNYAVTAASQRTQLLNWLNANTRPVEQVEVRLVDRDFDCLVHDEMPPAKEGARVEKKLLDVSQVPPEWATTIEPSRITTRPFFPSMEGEVVSAAIKAARKDPTLLSPKVLRALEIRAHVGQTSTAKFEKMLEIVAPDSTLKNMLVYHGASTGRYASRGGLNLQNLARPDLLVDAKKGINDIEVAHEILGRGDHGLAYLLWGDRVMDAAVACIRGVLKAPPGYEFIDADFSSVENRVGAWIAGQDDKLELFRQGLDEYKTFAANTMFKVPYDEVTKEMRQFCKAPILGGMFGQGWYGLIDYAAGIGVTLTPKQSKEAINAYREEYYKVKQTWYKCGDAAVEAVRNPGVWIHAGEKLTLAYHKKFLWMRLPSGRLICWYDPRIEVRRTPWGEDKDSVTVMGTNSVTKQWERDVLIGSSIYQSAVQGTARDLQINGVMNVEDAGYPVVLLVHDEQLSLVPEGFGSVEEYGTLMCKPTTWGSDIPLAYEGWRGLRFAK